MEEYKAEELQMAGPGSVPPSPQDLVLELELDGVDLGMTAPWVLKQLRMPRLLFFLGRHLSKRAVLCVVPLSLQGAGRGSTNIATVSLRVPASWLRTSVPLQYAGFGVTLYDSLELHEQDDPPKPLPYKCWQPRAYGWMPLAPLLHAQKRFLMHLMDPSHTPDPLHVLSLQLHKGAGTRIPPASASFRLVGSHSRELEAQVDASMRQIYELALQQYGEGGFVAWQPELESMHVPIWPASPAGSSLPGAAFCLEVPLRASHASEAWPALERCIRTAICTDSWEGGEAEFLEVLQSQLQQTQGDSIDTRYHRAVRTLQQAVCLAANSCDYTPDVGLDPDQPDVERFVDASKTRADSAKLCFLMAWMLLLAGCKPALLAGKALLYWAGVAMRTLVPCMITTSASSPSAGGGGAQFTQAAPEPINHIAGMLVPRFLFCRWLANSGRSGMSYERLKLACEVATDQRERPWERVHSKLWGTTFCDGGFEPYQMYFAPNERDAVRDRVILRERARMQMENEQPSLRRMNLQASSYNLFTDDVRTLSLEEFSPFYRYPDHVWSPAMLMWRARADAYLPLVIDFHIRYTEAGSQSYGVRLQDLVALCSEEIALEPVYEMSPEVYEHMLHRVAQQEPVLVAAPDLSVPSGKPSCDPARVPSEAELARTYPLLGELLSFSNKGTPPKPDLWTTITYRVNHAGKLTRDLVDALAATSRTHDFPIAVHVHPLGVGELYIVEVKLCLGSADKLAKIAPPSPFLSLS